MSVLSKDEIINLLKKGSCNLSNEQIIEFIEEQERLRIVACDELYEEMVERQKAEVRIEKELGLKKLAKKEKEIEELKASLQIGDEVDSSPVQNKPSQVESIWVKYEVNVGGGCATGSVLVPENASDDDIKVAIIDDLYFVDYEKESIKDDISYDEDGLQYCPNCGCQATLQHKNNKYFYECGGCWTESDNCLTKEEAKENWNKLKKGD